MYDNDLDGTFETTFVTPGVSARATDRVLDDARHQPHTDEWIVGYRQQLPGQISVDASIVRREFRDRTALVEINAIYEGTVFRGYRNEAFNEIFRVTNNVWNWPVYTFAELLVQSRRSASRPSPATPINGAISPARGNRTTLRRSFNRMRSTTVKGSGR